MSSRMAFLVAALFLGALIPPASATAAEPTALDTCPHYASGHHDAAVSVEGTTSEGNVTSSATAATSLCVLPWVSVLGDVSSPAGEPPEITIIPSGVSPYLTTTAGLSSDPAIRALIGSAVNPSPVVWVVVVSSL